MRATARWRSTAWMKNAELLEVGSGEATDSESESCRSVGDAEFDADACQAEDSDAKAMSI